MLPDGLGNEHPIDALLFIADNVLLHEIHGHGPPIFFNKTERSFKAGPNFIFKEFTK